MLLKLKAALLFDRTSAAFDCCSALKTGAFQLKKYLAVNRNFKLDRGLVQTSP
jgi:hypothetical protein